MITGWNSVFQDASWRRFPDTNKVKSAGAPTTDGVTTAGTTTGGTGATTSGARATASASASAASAAGSTTAVVSSHWSQR